MRALSDFLVMLALTTVLFFLGLSSLANAEPIERISVNANGEEADGTSRLPVVSATGRYVVFVSSATNLVEGDTNGHEDVFLKDRQTGEVELISVASDGTQGNDWSGETLDGAGFSRLDVSPDGRFVVFDSGATNLVAGDVNGQVDLFLRDRETQQTEIVSLDADGNPADLSTSVHVPAMSDDGRFVAFVASERVLVRDRLLGETVLTSQSTDGVEANDVSTFPDISGDGRFVSFNSVADNLVPDDTNEAMDVFVRDMLNEETIRISVSSDGMQGDDGSDGHSMAASGRFILFKSDAMTLVGDASEGDLYLRDISSETTERVVTVDTGSVTLGRRISTDGRFILFGSDADTLVEDDTNDSADLFRYERATGEVVLLTRDLDGLSASGTHSSASISDDGRVVVFDHTGDNLVEGDENGVRDIFATGDILPENHPYEYAAKIVCGVQSDQEDLRLTPGLYATTINIHNPSGVTAVFSKKLALGVPPGGQGVGEIYPIAVHEIGYDEVLSVDCNDIRARLFPDGFPSADDTTGAYIEGYLVLESLSPLDVTAVYTTAAILPEGGIAPHSSIDVETVPERRRSADLSVVKTVSTVSLEVTDGARWHIALYTIVIDNAGPDGAGDVALLDVLSLAAVDAFAGAAFVTDFPNLISLPPGAEITDVTFVTPTLSTMEIALGDLPAGEQVEVIFPVLALTITVGFDDPHVLLTDTVSVSSAAVDPLAGNNSFTIETVLIP